LKQKHYRRPPRVGERCLVDGVETYAAFDADLIDFRILARSVDAHYGEVPPEEPAYYYTQMSAKPLETEFYVGGASDDEAQINLSRLVEASKHCVLRKEGSDFEYPAILTGYEMEHTGVEHYLLVTMNFTARLRKPLVDCELTGSGTVYNEGNLASGYRLTVHPKQDMESVTVAGMTLKNLHAGKDFTVDGIEYRVTEEGVNRFADTDITAFPQMLPGENYIEIPDGVKVTIAFYPAYL